MDITIKKEDLLRELQYVQGVVERKTTVPILSNLLLETAGNSLVITATDLDVTLRCSCQANIKVSGAATVSAQKLFGSSFQSVDIGLDQSYLRALPI